MPMTRVPKIGAGVMYKNDSHTIMNPQSLLVSWQNRERQNLDAMI